jgi:hypothetical protein
MFDGKAFGQEIVGVVKDFVGKELAPILSRMDAIEKRFNELPEPKDATGPDFTDLCKTITDELASLRVAVDTIELPELPDIPAMVTEEVQKAVAAVPAPKDGKSVTTEDVAPLIASEVERRIKELPAPRDGQDGKDGESIDPAEVQRMVSKAVEKAVSAIPAPKDGKDGMDGKDGIGLAGAMIDRAGELVVTLTNGETRNLGPVVGKDGALGEKGIDGMNGRDGFGFEDLDLVETDQGVILRFMRGGHVKDFRLPIIVDRGVYKEGQTYRPGDGVTWGGSYWICQEETADKPDSGKGFRLAVKKGRDGRDGVMKEAKVQQPVRVGVPEKVD